MREEQWTKGRSPFPRRNRVGGVFLKPCAASAATVVVIAAGCNKQAPCRLPPPIVQVAEVTLANVPMSTEFIGQLDSPQNVEVRARVEAFVDKMLFTEGTEVKEGDPLFELDKKPFRGTAGRRQRDAGRGEGGVEQVREGRRPAHAAGGEARHSATGPRQRRRLGGRGQGERAVRARPGWSRRRLDLGYCDVKSADHRADRGQAGFRWASLVGKGEPTLLATISQLDPIWFYCNVSEVQLSQGRSRDPAHGQADLEDLPITLILADGSVHPDQGKIVFHGPRGGCEDRHACGCAPSFPIPRRCFGPGMFARIKVDIGVRPDSILVPERAVTELQGKNFVVGHRRRQQGDAARRQGGRNDRRERADPGGA